MRRLLALGRDPDLQHLWWNSRAQLHVPDRPTCLHAAAMRDPALSGDVDCDTVKALLEGGANFDLVQSNGKTPLSYAANHGRTPCVQLLLEAGANFEIVDTQGFSPLMHAARRGHIEATQLLLDAGVRAHHRLRTIFAYRWAAFSHRRRHIMCCRRTLTSGRSRART